MTALVVAGNSLNTLRGDSSRHARKPIAITGFFYQVETKKKVEAFVEKSMSRSLEKEKDRRLQGESPKEALAQIMIQDWLFRLLLITVFDPAMAKSFQSRILTVLQDGMEHPRPRTIKDFKSPQDDFAFAVPSILKDPRTAALWRLGCRLAPDLYVESSPFADLKDLEVELRGCIKESRYLSTRLNALFAYGMLEDLSRAVPGTSSSFLSRQIKAIQHNSNLFPGNVVIRVDVSESADRCRVSWKNKFQRREVKKGINLVRFLYGIHLSERSAIQGYEVNYKVLYEKTVKSRSPSQVELGSVIKKEDAIAHGLDKRTSIVDNKLDAIKQSFYRALKEISNDDQEKRDLTDQLGLKFMGSALLTNFGPQHVRIDKHLDFRKFINHVACET